MTTQQVWLTQEAYDKLKAEYDHLSGPGRAEITSRIEAAREEGDLKENGGYHAAKEEQGKQEARIRQLEQLLREASVGETPATGGLAGPGMVVEVRFPGDKDTTRFVLGFPGGPLHLGRGLLAAVAAGQGRDRARSRRHRALQAAQRKGRHRRDHFGGALQRLTPNAAVICGHAGTGSRTRCPAPRCWCRARPAARCACTSSSTGATPGGCRC